MNKKKLLLGFLVILPLLAGLACRLPFIGRFFPAEPVVEEIVVNESSPEVPVIEEIDEVPEETQALASEYLTMPKETFWVQTEDQVFAAFFFENPNRDILIEDVEYTISFYDSSQVELLSETYYLCSILPGQVVGIPGTYYLESENDLVDSVSVDWQYESASAAADATNPFVISKTVFWPNANYPIVSGIISNNAASTFTDVQTNIICYNSAGEIVGGGYTFVNFVRGNDYTGFSTYVDVFDEVASVEVFPMSTYITSEYPGADYWSDISVFEDNFYPGDYGNIIGGFVVQNNTDAVLGNSMVQVVFFDEAGYVTAIGTQFIDILLPGEVQGVSPWIISPPEGAETNNYDVWVLPGERLDTYEFLENPFVVTDASISGDFLYYVDVTLTNTYTKQVSEVDVTVLLYDADGTIIGGGTSWSSEPTPPGGSTTVEVWVDYGSSRVIDSIKVWVTPSYWTEYE